MDALKRKAVYDWQKAAAGIFFPQRLCVHCGSVSPGQALCPACEGERVKLRACPYCATFIAATETIDYCCHECRHERPPFSLARAALPYAGYLRERLLDFKYHDRVGLRRPLAALLLAAAAELPDTHFDAALPIPLSQRRAKARGYNQAELLSALVSAELGLEHQPGYLRRVKDTRPLANLSRQERERELAGAFQALPAAAGRRLLLIDDIYTSGATAAMASRALLRAGAASVAVLTVAAGWDL